MNNPFNYAAHPPLKSSISEILDENDKKALYRASKDPPGQSYEPFIRFGSPLQMSFKDTSFKKPKNDPRPSESQWAVSGGAP